MTQGGLGLKVGGVSEAYTIDHVTLLGETEKEMFGSSSTIRTDG